MKVRGIKRRNRTRQPTPPSSWVELQALTWTYSWAGKLRSISISFEGDPT